MLFVTLAFAQRINAFLDPALLGEYLTETFQTSPDANVSSIDPETVTLVSETWIRFQVYAHRL